MVTLYVMEEGHPFFTQQRFQAMGIPPTYHLALRREVIIHEPKKLDAIIKRAKEVAARLIVLDPLSDMVNVEEHDNSAMKVVNEAMRRLKLETGAAVVALHHSTKSAGHREDGNPQHYISPDQYNMRGASVLAGGADLMLELRRPKESDVEADIHMVKARFLPHEPPGRLILSTENDPQTGLLTKARVTWLSGAEAVQKRDEAKKAREAVKASGASVVEKEVLDYLQKRGPSSCRNIVDALGMPVRSVQGALGRMAARDLVHNRGPGTRPNGTLAPGRGNENRTLSYTA